MGSSFRILGPLEVDDAPALGGPKPRALLARLLLEPNQVVGEALLVDTLWGEEPPERARHALQVYVSSLRRALGPERIRHARGGYAAVVEPDELDLSRFERLTAEGGELLRAGNAAEARSRLEEALSLWRGPALVDVAPALESERARLEELRILALEDRVEAELALGRERQVVPELERLVAEHPLRERPTQQLMLALYRAGRQTDALAVYRIARDVLRDELGLEPGAELRELEGAILRQERSLHIEPAEPLTRRRLPSPATPLIGRRAEIEAVTDLLRGEARLVTITGPGGTGKTRVALQAATEAADRFDDGAVFVDLAAVHDPDAVEDAIARAVDDEPRDDLEETLRQRATLLLLDNFEQVDAAAPLVSRLLAGAPRLRVLVTSRHPLRLYGEHQHRLPPLDLDTEAVPLFVDRARARGVEVSSSETVETICCALDCLPLAIELAAGRVAQLSLDEMLERLSERLVLASAGPRDVPERHRTMAATIAWSYDLLDVKQQRLFQALAVFVGGWDEDAAEAVIAADRVTLLALAAHNLVVVAERRYGMLETIRAFAVERLELSGDADELRAKHARHFHALVTQAKAGMRGADAPEWLTRLDSERGNITAALEWSLEHNPEIGLELADGLFLYWLTRGLHQEALRWYDRALDLADADEAARAETLKLASGFAFRCRDFERAERYAAQARAYFERVGDRANQARLEGMFGLFASERGDYESAVARLSASVALARESGDAISLGFALSNLGTTATAAGEHDTGTAALVEALDLVRASSPETPRLTDQRFLLQSLGTVDLLAGRLQEARTRIDEALSIALEFDEPEGIVSGLLGLARLAASEDDGERAARLLGAAEAVLAETGIRLERFELEQQRNVAAAAERQLGDEAYSSVYAEGRSLTREEAVRLALAH